MMGLVEKYYPVGLTISKGFTGHKLMCLHNAADTTHFSFLTGACEATKTGSALQERLDKAFVVNVPGFFHILW